jgi:hypothetical protein
MVVVAAMERAGWTQVGGRDGQYTRLRLLGEERTSTLVPLDPSAGDYPDLMGAVVAELVAQTVAGFRAMTVLDALTPEDGETQ